MYFETVTAIKFQMIFDITTSVWLRTEDKLFYKQQLDSNGNIGFYLEIHNLVGEMNTKVATIVLWK